MSLLLTLLGSCSFGQAEESTYMGRSLAPTMHYLGAEWLMRQTRESEENPAALLDALQLSPGDVACDVGSGSGYHTLRMAPRVGESGRVYAIDIQPEMLDMLQESAREAGLMNVQAVQNTQTETGLDPGTCDVILLVDVYHELSQPAEMLKDMRAALKPNGVIALVEFRAEDPRVPIKPLHKMSKAQIMKELPPSGLKLVREVNTLPWQHVMFFQRDDGPARPISPAP
jgi:ubiquinone/menaquinone biosynthesis C-methylase UbiE